MSRIIIPLSVNNPIVVNLPLLKRDNSNGDYNDAATIDTIDIKLTYRTNAGSYITLTSTAVPAAHSGDDTLYHLDVSLTDFTDIDDSYPIAVSVIDQTDPKTYIDTGYELYIDSFVDLQLDIPKSIDLRKGAVQFWPLPMLPWPVDREGKSIGQLIDDSEIAVKATNELGTAYNRFYDDVGFTTPATASTTFAGFYKFKASANGNVVYSTYFQLSSDDSPTPNYLVLHYKYKVLGNTRELIRIIQFENTELRINQNQKITDILADTNETQTKLPTNEIMGSSDKNDYNDEIINILADTNEIQGKLPTNEIMGSTDKSSYNGAIADTNSKVTLIKSKTDLSLPDYPPGITNGLIVSGDDNNRIVGIVGTKNDLDDLNDITVDNIKTMTIDSETFEAIMTMVFSRTRGTYIINEEESTILFKTKGGLSNAYKVKFDETGRQEQTL